MSINKRKVIGYDDVDETTDAKRIRYEGYNYSNGAQRVQNEDAEPDIGTEEDTVEASPVDLTAVQTPRPRRNDLNTDRRRDQGKQASNGPRTDGVTGMRTFIPGLDDEDESEQDAETLGAMAYLRSVRSEATGIPNLLVAPRPVLDVASDEAFDDIYEPSRGYYSDGAYVCAPSLGPFKPDHASTSMAPQDAYQQQLLRRFKSASQTLHSQPTAGAIAALSDSHPISFPNADGASKQWAYIIREQAPHPVQLASMDTETVLRLIRMCTGKLKRRRVVSRNLSRWIWSLLARLPEVGTLSSEEVSGVRDLGKRAVWVGLGWQDAALAAATAEQYNEQEETEAVVHDEANGPDENTKATLLMILTIAGEVYGQRDLLEFREHWTSEAMGNT